MVRAGAASHPGDWEQSGYREIQKAPKRYAMIDLAIERVVAWSDPAAPPVTVIKGGVPVVSRHEQESLLAALRIVVDSNRPAAADDLAADQGTKCGTDRAVAGVPGVRARERSMAPARERDMAPRSRVLHSR